MKIDDLKQIVEAILFASDEPLSAKDLHKIVDEVDANVKDIKSCIETLNNEYLAENRAFALSEQGGGWQFTTTAAVKPWMMKLFAKKQNQRLSQRALETLSIVAYNQPITKSEIEDIRGVNSDGIVRSLLEKDLVSVVGRQKSPGNPMLYATTRNFLLHFGINSVKDLPNLKEIDELLKDDLELRTEVKQLAPEELGLQLEQIKKAADNKNKNSVSESLHEE
jgi:segregation and condensation protein B